MFGYQDRKATGLPSWQEEAATHKPTGPVSSPEDRKSSSRKKKRSRTHKPKPKVKAQLAKHKFVESVDDQHIMEYGLTKEEIMNYRKHRFNISNQPLVEVKMNKTAEMKEEFGTYCGIKKTIKNWLYYV
ncbi:hypothetical protein U1Q18_051078 [Sarracenia purpurea var. burkii]